MSASSNTRHSPLRRLSARFLDALARSYRFNAAWREANRDLVCGQQAGRPTGVTYAPPLARYAGADGASAADAVVAAAAARADGARPLFVTARFRSGSTLLWNIFRHTPGVTAYYEPLNERQWFRGGADADVTDPTHLHAERYGAEYAGLGELGRWFDPDWTFRDLYMDARSCDRRLARYLAELIRRAPHRPVLQCNRLDFRLPWLRRVFPQADVLHLYRNPREQWLSVQRSSSGAPPTRRLTPEEPEDYFYTLAWARDLRRVFPCVDPSQHEHAYAVHYLLWRLSYLFGARYADISIAYEDLMADCVDALAPAFAHFDIAGGKVTDDTYAALIKPAEPERWPEYANAEWFAAIEADCERELARFLGA